MLHENANTISTREVSEEKINFRATRSHMTPASESYNYVRAWKSEGGSQNGANMLNAIVKLLQSFAVSEHFDM
jgi:hypothetical protein